MASATGEPSTSDEPSSSSFKYQHHSTSYSVELSVTDAGAVECPGCGDPKKQLVRHLKSDQACKKRCEEIDLGSFDKQLKDFRNRKRVKASRQQSRDEDLEGFLEKQRVQQQARKGRRKTEDEEGFLKKHRDQEQERKERQKAEDETGFLEKKRDQEQARKRKRKAEDEEGFLEKQRGQQQARKQRRRDEDGGGFKARQRKEKRTSRKRCSEKQKGAIGRARKFQRAVMLADIFICSCCERRLFEQNVIPLGDLREKVELKKAGV